VTASDQIALTLYVREIADRFGLKDWEFDVDREPTDSVYDATTSTTSGKKYAVLWFRYDVRLWKLERLREVVLHELLHWHLAGADAAIQMDILPEDDPRYKLFERFLEYSIDGIATAIAPHYPLISWPDTPADSSSPSHQHHGQDKVVPAPGLGADIRG